MEFLVTPPEGVPRGWMLSVNRTSTCGRVYFGCSYSSESV